MSTPLVWHVAIKNSPYRLRYSLEIKVQENLLFVTALFRPRRARAFNPRFAKWRIGWLLAERARV